MTKLLILSLGFFAIAALFIGISWKSTKQRWAFGVLTLALSAPFFYWLGMFAEQFSSGLCYSSAISSITNAIEATDSPKELADQVRALPLAGYETNCQDLEVAASKLPNAGAP